MIFVNWHMQQITYEHHRLKNLGYSIVNPMVIYDRPPKVRSIG